MSGRQSRPQARRRTGSAAEYRARRSRAYRRGQGWPYCEHCGDERIVGTAAQHIAILNHGAGPDDLDVVAPLAEAIAVLAGRTGPDALIGVCIACGCMKSEDEPRHRD